jgi:NADH dehydrogenase
MFGARDRFLNLFARLSRFAPVIALAGADARFQPVWVDDVAAAIVRSLDTPSTIGQVLECAGPTVCTLKDLVSAAGRWSGHPRHIIPLPDALGRVQAAMLELLPGTPLLSRDNLDSMKVPNVASGKAPGLDSLGIHPSSLETVMRPLLERRSGVQRLEPWRAQARRL